VVDLSGNQLKLNSVDESHRRGSLAGFFIAVLRGQLLRAIGDWRRSMKKRARILAFTLCAVLLLSGLTRGQLDNPFFDGSAYGKLAETQLDSLNVRCVGRVLCGRCYAVMVENYAYIGGGACILALDISDPGNPQVRGKIHIP
jgi:hypothetical protein